MRPLIALAIVAGFVVAAAGLARVVPTTEHTRPAVAAPEDRFSALPAWLWQSYAAEKYGIAAVDESTYRWAIHKVKEGGLESLSDDERGLVIAISWSTLAWQAETTRYRVQTQNPRGGPPSEHVDETRYLLEDLGGISLKLPVAQRRYTGEGLDEWISILYPSSGDHPAISIITWTKQDSDWSCTRYSPPIDYFLHDMTSHLILEPELVKGNLVGREDVSGSMAYKIVAQPVAETAGYSKPVALWLDASTFLPRQFEYVSVNTRESGWTFTSTVLEVNGPISIEAPSEAMCREEG